MFIKVDTPRGVANLEDPADTEKLFVQVVGDADAEEPLRAFGRLDGAGHAWIELVAVKAAAAGRVPDEWLGSFDAMVERAREQGRLSEDGESVRAEIEQVDPPAEKRRFLR
jgi:hypothetical protein